MPDMAVDFGSALVNLHRQIADLDEGDGNTLAVRLYHMLMDLRRLAMVMGVDFDATVQQVAADYPEIYDEETPQ